MVTLLRTDIISENADMSFLIISRQDYEWIDVLQNIAENVYRVRTRAECQQAFLSLEFDIILYVGKSFDSMPVDVIAEIKLQAPQSILAIISNDLSIESYSELIHHGATDALPMDLSTDRMLQRLGSLVQKRLKNREVVVRTRRLHAINLISQKLHNAEHPTLLVSEAIELICKYFDVYAVAITIDQGSHLHLYAGTHDSNNLRRVYESSAEMNPLDPLCQVVSSGVSLIFKDIKRHPQFTPIPVIQNPSSALIVPIKQGLKTIGSLSIFAKDNEFSSTDVAIFELLANNLGTAYYNITHYYSREMDTRAMRVVLKAWHTLNSIFSKHAIAKILHDYIQEIETSKVVGVWLFSDDNKEDVLYSSVASLYDSLQLMAKEEKLHELLNEFKTSFHAITLHKRMVQTEVLTALFQLLDSSQISLIPIAGNSFSGLILLSSQHTQPISQTDMSLIENLARVTANIIERNTLIETIEAERRLLQEQTARIEGVLRSIGEGIFFVDDKNQVVYCTPQFTEISGISPTQVLNKPFTKLFQFLSIKSSDRQNVFEQLNAAAEQIQGKDMEDVYASVEINNPAEEGLQIQFMRVDSEHSMKGWIGIVSLKDNATHAAATDSRTALFQNLMEDMSLPLMDLHKTTMMLPEQHEILSSDSFSSVLQGLEKSVQDIESMWGNFIQVYKGELSGIQVRSSSIEADAFIEGLLTMRHMYLYHRQIRFESQAPQSAIEMDERLMRRCFINLIKFMSHIANRGAPIFVSIAKEGRQIVFSLQEKTTFLDDETYNNLFLPKHDEKIRRDMYPYRLGMYLSKQIVEAHKGQLSISRGRGVGVLIKVSLPQNSDEEIQPEPIQEDYAAYKQPSNGLTMTVLESPAHFLSKLYPQIQGNGHEVILESRLDDVLTDLKMTKVDIIVLEADRANTGLVGQVQRIRAQSEVPIVIISLPEFENDCLQGLAHGADDYFTIPLNEEKLLAQLYAIAKRQELASRTAEPITVGDLTIDFSRRRVFLNGKLVNLTTIEYELLRVLVMNRGYVMTHQRLLAKVWGPEYDSETQYLWVNISRLRRKLEPMASSPRYILNEPRVGYVFRDVDDEA